MIIFDVFSNVWGFVRSIFAHRMRAVLTLLGIVIGTGSIVLLASLIRGGESYLVHASQEAEDSDIIEAYSEDAPADQQNKTTRMLTRADADALSQSTTGTLANAMVEPESSRDTYAFYQGRRKRVAMVSAGKETLRLYRLRVESGRALDEEDRTAGNRVCVIGHEIYEELLQPHLKAKSSSSEGADAPARAPTQKITAGSLAGLRLEIDGRLFAIVGVLAKKPMIGSTDSTYLWDRKVMIPETTYDTLYSTMHQVDRIYVRPNLTTTAKGGEGGEGSSAGRTTAARTTTRGVLLRRHLGVMNFALSKDQSGGTEKLILDVIQILLLSAGVLALLASGINIMNVMLVTVSERKCEIGLRRAIGATPRAILVQFLLEAMTLSLVGSLIGVAVGIALAWSTATLARSGIGYWELTIPSWSVVLGIALAVITGLVFGIVPAWRAARISPIEALRAD